MMRNCDLIGGSIVFEIGDFVCCTEGDPEFYGIGIIKAIGEDNMYTVEWTTEDGESFIACHFPESLE